MKLRNGKTYKDDEPEDEYDWGYGINPETGGCDCLDCTRIVGCVFHASQDERKKKAETKARTQVLYEAEVYAMEKCKNIPEGIQFLDYYLLHYRTYYQQKYNNTYQWILDGVNNIYWNRLMRKKKETRGYICEVCDHKCW
jgi:hypothetical protein